jgi:hypothetical protein
MRFDSDEIAEPVWLRDQTARILHRHVLFGKHFRVDVDALLSKVRRLRRRLVVFGLAALTGCTYIQGQVAADSEEILAQAGFQNQPLDERGLPSRQLVEQADVYKFADPDFCRCVFVGSANEHAELQRLRAERIAEREWIMVRLPTASNIDRTIWGPWKPEGLDVVSFERAAGRASPERAAALGGIQP